MTNAADDKSLLAAWQRHVIECARCGAARDGSELCQMGQNFWRIPGSATMPAQPPQSQQVVVNVGQLVQQGQPAFDLNDLVVRVSEKVVARASSGAAIAVPMEKTSRAISIATAPGVVLNMPERDIEVYSAMKAAIPVLLRLAEMLGTAMLASEEARRIARRANVVIEEDQLAMVVRHAAQARGIRGLTPEALHDEFSRATNDVMRLGDVMARFMNVDEDTRAVMREVRGLAVEMKGQLERSSSSSLVLDDEVRQITRGLRMAAVSLQGEMERRLGT